MQRQASYFEWYPQKELFYEILKGEEKERFNLIDSYGIFQERLDDLKQSQKLDLRLKGDQTRIEEVIKLWKPLARAADELSKAKPATPPSRTVWGSLYTIIEILGERADALRNVLFDCLELLTAIPESDDYIDALPKCEALRICIFELYDGHVSVCMRAIKRFGRKSRTTGTYRARYASLFPGS
jgi:hypothetical protein